MFIMVDIKNKTFVFPAPREVDRYLYTLISPMIDEYIAEVRFPAPREVDRYLYEILSKIWYYGTLFPAPREVDRDLYSMFTDGLQHACSSFRPLAR